MGNSKKPQQDDPDNDGIPDDEPPQSLGLADQDKDADALPDGENRVSANPIIINR